MKQQLLSFLLISTTALFAQQPITNFLGGPNMFYASLQPNNLPDQSSSGSNQSLVYPSVTNGSVVETVETPTAAELVNFPGATHVFRTSGIIDGNPTTSNSYVIIIGSSLQVIGLIVDTLTLKYDTNSATVGTYPLPYNFQNFDDAVSGTFVYGQYTGTFSGTLTTSVDAAGGLSIGNSETFNVTRLRSSQALDLSYGNFGVVGNLTIQSSNYYTDNATPEFPILRQATTSLVVPLLQINESRTRVEVASQFANTGFEPIANNRLSLAENPVNQQLELVTDAQITSVEIFNIQGKLMGTYSKTLIDVSNYASGVYVAVVSSAYGNKTIKFVKN
ncbi:T9SS type A sorting domain-containing protein [Flavobacterium sp.]|uniref:T9SS type A sorting domain-containing protein n=1 Tax=Flavobacterium sp. TaxID=239 RepID=UPI003B999C95